MVYLGDITPDYSKNMDSLSDQEFVLMLPMLKNLFQHKLNTGELTIEEVAGYMVEMEVRLRTINDNIEMEKKASKYR